MTKVISIGGLKNPLAKDPVDPKINPGPRAPWKSPSNGSFRVALFGPLVQFKGVSWDHHLRLPFPHLITCKEDGGKKRWVFLCMACWLVDSCIRWPTVRCHICRAPAPQKHSHSPPVKTDLHQALTQLVRLTPKQVMRGLDINWERIIRAKHFHYLYWESTKTINTSTLSRVSWKP